LNNSNRFCYADSFRLSSGRAATSTTVHRSLSLYTSAIVVTPQGCITVIVPRRKHHLTRVYGAFEMSTSQTTPSYCRHWNAAVSGSRVRVSCPPVTPTSRPAGFCCCFACTSLTPPPQLCHFKIRFSWSFTYNRRHV